MTGQPAKGVGTGCLLSLLIWAAVIGFVVAVAVLAGGAR